MYTFSIENENIKKNVLVILANFKNTLPFLLRLRLELGINVSG